MLAHATFLLRPNVCYAFLGLLTPIFHSGIINLVSLKKTMYKLILLFTVPLILSCSEANSNQQQEQHPVVVQETVEVYLLNSLNDSRGYCIDMMGYKTNADKTKSLQAHSCYSYQGEISVDQGFDKARILNEEFYIPHFNTCMEADKFEPSSSLKLSSCDTNDKQKFILQTDGRIQPKNDLSLCLTVSENYRDGGGGSPVHLIRNLTLENCDETFSSRQKWGIRKTN